MAFKAMAYKAMAYKIMAYIGVAYIVDLGLELPARRAIREAPVVPEPAAQRAFASTAGSGGHTI